MIIFNEKFNKLIKIISQNNLLTFLGFITVIPFFIIFEPPYVYINFIENIFPWYNPIRPNVHPSYTYSLGMAAPICLFTISLTFFVCVLRNKALFNSQPKFSIFILILSCLALILLSGSLKILGLVSSCLAFFMFTFILMTPQSKFFSLGYIYGISSFFVLHFVSTILDGLQFSFKSQAISIFRLEIYQALVSYPAMASFFLGSLLLSPQIIKPLIRKSNSYVLYKILYIIITLSTFLIIIALSRRISIIIIFFALLLIMVKYFKKVSKLFFFSGGSLVLLISYYSLGKIYTGEKSLEFVNWFGPRLNYYLATINSVLDKTIYEQLFGTNGDWATRHNTVLDFLDYTGIIGISIFIFMFIILSMNFFKANLSEYVTWNKNAVIYSCFAAFTFSFDNIVNSNISLPYYAVNFLIIFSLSIISLLDNQLFKK